MNQVEKKGCLARNWKWMVPVGCLGLIVAAVAVVLIIVLVVFGAIKSSDVYQEALRRAQTSPAVVSALGQPVEAGWLVSGSVNVNSGGGEADLKIPISGPKGNGTVYAVATSSGGDWDYSKLEVEVEGQSRRIDLNSSR